MFFVHFQVKVSIAKHVQLYSFLPLHCHWLNFGPGCGVENIGGDELFFNTQYIFQNYNTCVPGGRGLSSLYWQDSFNVIASPLDVCCHGDWDAGKKNCIYRTEWMWNSTLSRLKTSTYFSFSVNKYFEINNKVQWLILVFCYNIMKPGYNLMILLARESGFAVRLELDNRHVKL